MITWTIPTGTAADKTASRLARFASYRQTHSTRLANGVRPRPNLKTIGLILDAYDLFGAALTVESGSYTTPT